MFRKFITLAVAAIAGISGAMAWEYNPSEENLKAREEFRDHGFGIFLHWGIYSMLGQGEWAMETLQLPLDEYQNFRILPVAIQRRPMGQGIQECRSRIHHNHNAPSRRVLDVWHKSIGL